jgi:hypothetical protein
MAAPPLTSKGPSSEDFSFPFQPSGGQGWSFPGGLFAGKGAFLPQFVARCSRFYRSSPKHHLFSFNLHARSSDFFLCDNSPKWRYIFFGGNLWQYILTFLVDEIARLLPISRWYPSFLDENTQIWMNNYTFIHNLDVSSTHMDEGGSCTVVKIASLLILIIEKKISGEVLSSSRLLRSTRT